MKKFLIFLSIFIAWIYLSGAINIVLNSWQKLENSHWNNLSGVLNKVDVSWDDLSVNWKLSVDWKICLEDWSCLGECSWSEIWDVNTSSCVTPATTPETAWETCYTIKQANASAIDWKYWIDPNGGNKADAFEVYCDMTNDWWGWTKVIWINPNSRMHATSWSATPENVATWWYWKISDNNINLIKSKWQWELRFECKWRSYYVYSCTLNSVSSRWAACMTFSKIYWWTQYTWAYWSDGAGINIHQGWDWQNLVSNSSYSYLNWCQSTIAVPTHSWGQSWSLWAK
jgi:hypothetical protein